LGKTTPIKKQQTLTKLISIITKWLKAIIKMLANKAIGIK
jgi:hypothetical protein